MTITALILFSLVAGRYLLDADCDFYVPGCNNERVAMHPWSRTVQYVHRHYDRNRMQFTSQMWRVILYLRNLDPEGGRRQTTEVI